MIAILKAVQHGVIDQVGERLTDRARVAVEFEVFEDFRLDTIRGAFKRRIQGKQDFLNHFANLESSPLGTGLIDSDLLETADQFRRTLNIAQGDVAAGIDADHEIVQRRAAQALSHRLTKGLQAVADGRNGHQAVADRGVEFVGNASHQIAECRELFGLDEIFLGCIEVFYRGLEFIVGLRQGFGAIRDTFLQHYIQGENLSFDVALYRDIHVHANEDRSAVVAGNGENGGQHHDFPAILMQ